MISIDAELRKFRPQFRSRRAESRGESAPLTVFRESVAEPQSKRRVPLRERMLPEHVEQAAYQPQRRARARGKEELCATTLRRRETVPVYE